MRYFKWEGSPSAEDKEYVDVSPKPTKQEKKRWRKGRFLNVLATILWMIFGSLLTVGSIFIFLSVPLPSNPFLKILLAIVVTILLLIAAIVCFLLSGIMVSPILKKSEDLRLRNKKIFITRFCLKLREFYGWQEPCLVTKCYRSHDEKFNDHDVCIFLAEKEFRLTANLKYGVSPKEKDLGCYVFSPDEISLAKIQGEQCLMTELKAGDFVFLLGRRAKGFIENNLLAQGSDASTFIVTP